MVALALSILVTVPFALVLARRRVLRRLALRNAMRRPKEGLLVVVGSLLGAAIITGSFVVGDTMDSSIRQLARTHLGPIDELVVTNDREEWWTVASRLRSLRDPRVDGVLPLAKLDAASISGASGTLRTAPHVQILALDFRTAQRFGGDTSATGIQGPPPTGDEVAITRDLANELAVGPGGVIDTYAYGMVTHLVVTRVLPRRGVAGFWLGTGPKSFNVFVSPEIFESIVHDGHLQGAPPQWAV